MLSTGSDIGVYDLYSTSVSFEVSAIVKYPSGYDIQITAFITGEYFREF